MLLQLNTGTDVDPNTAQEITNQLNNTEYPAITDQIISGFSVGDTFFYWPSVDAPGNTPIIFSGNLSVQEAGNPAVPEPGTLALLMTAGLALGVLSLRRTMTNGQARRSAGQYGLTHVWLLHTRPRTQALSQYPPVSPTLPLLVASAPGGGVAQPPRRSTARIRRNFMSTSNAAYSFNA